MAVAIWKTRLTLRGKTCLLDAAGVACGVGFRMTYNQLNGSTNSLLHSSKRRTYATITHNPSTHNPNNNNQCTDRSNLNQVIQSFSNSKVSYSSKSTYELLRGYAVFKICGISWIVKNADKILTLSNRLFGDRFVRVLLKSTFFGHFCAGEDDKSIYPTLSHLHQNGIGGILDYAAEADITVHTPKTSVVHKNIDNEVQCRIYNYEGEAQCDKNVSVFMKAIEAVRDNARDGFAAVKVTALGQPVLLERISQAIVETRKLFWKFDEDRSGKVHGEEFKRVFLRVFGEAKDEEMNEIFSRFCDKETGYIDYVEWTNTIKIEEIWSLVERAREGEIPKQLFLNEEEKSLLRNMFGRLNQLAEYARKMSVRLMIDAEQTYFQPAIDHLTLNLQRRFNVEFPTIFMTYQCYLKDSYERVVVDLIRAKREGYFFAGKIVRGAYLVLERRRKDQLGIEDPIHNTLEDTHKNYHKVLDLILSNISVSNVLVATHNQDSIIYALTKMDELSITNTSTVTSTGSGSGVYFGQLLGMADHLTYNLGKNGYKAYKYVPYGSVKEVVPYLIRRAQENSNLLVGGVKVEIEMHAEELKRRLTFGLWKKKKT